MAKDPAFLFYPNDWIGGTMGMTFEEKGAYIEVLMMQFNRGRTQEHLIVRIIGKDLWDVVSLKFKKDENGLFYNERLEVEQNKRKEYSESRRKNRNNSANLKENESDDSKTKIYVIKDLESNNIKIGASINPKNRLSTLKYKLNKDLVLVAVFDDLTLRDEKDIHRHFIDFNIKGDWFSLKTNEVVDYISKTYDKHMSLHMENENENVNYNITNTILRESFVKFLLNQKVKKNDVQIELLLKKLNSFPNDNYRLKSIENAIRAGHSDFYELQGNDTMTGKIRQGTAYNEEKTMVLLDDGSWEDLTENEIRIIQADEYHLPKHIIRK